MVQVLARSPGVGDPVAGSPAADSRLPLDNPDGWTVEAHRDGAYGRGSMDWAAPLNVTASTLANVGNRVVAIRAGVRVWSDTPSERQRHWGICFGMSVPFSN